MSDESFFREVDQEFRQDQMKALWKRYGTLAIAAAVAIILVTAGFVGYRYWQEQRAAAAGDSLAAAIAEAEAGRTEAAMEMLRELDADGHGAYPVLARMRMGALLSDSGEAEDAVAMFDAVAADSSAPAAIRDMARLRAAFLLVDAGSYDDVRARAEQLASDENNLRHSAREALGLAAWRTGEAGAALGYFDQILTDEAAPSNTRRRAELMSELIRGSGAAS